MASDASAHNRDSLTKSSLKKEDLSRKTDSPKKGKVFFREVEEEITSSDIGREIETHSRASEKSVKSNRSKLDATISSVLGGSVVDKAHKKAGHGHGKHSETESYPKSHLSGEERASSSVSNQRPWEVDPSLLTFGSILGNGTYGKVYKGTYRGKEVAIKMLSWGNIRDHEEKEMISLQFQFFREVEVMYKLDSHPNVCKLLGAALGSTSFRVPPRLGEGTVQVSKMMCCIVMEFVSGGTLRQFWIQHRKSGKRRMPFPVMVQFALDIARGLAYLHSQKICHRDLKPDNILMDKNFVLKIADFGLSRVLPSRSEDSMSSHVGTPNYCAPEILDGKLYTYKCDVYSYAICVWELYACNVPYPDVYAIDSGKANKKIIDGTLRPQIPCCCPRILRKIMIKCWNPNPRKRPEMAEVVDWLSAIDVDKFRFSTSPTIVEGAACVGDAVSISC